MKKPLRPCPLQQALSAILAGHPGGPKSSGTKCECLKVGNMSMPRWSRFHPGLPMSSSPPFLLLPLSAPSLGLQHKSQCQPLLSLHLLGLPTLPETNLQTISTCRSVLLSLLPTKSFHDYSLYEFIVVLLRPSPKDFHHRVSEQTPRTSA